MFNPRLKLKILGTIIFLSTNLYSQNYSKAPLAISDIKKGINDFEYLRAVFIEKGFKFDQKDNDSEYWKIPVDDERTKDFFSQITLQLSTWKLNDQPFKKVLYLHIRKDLLVKYNDIFFSQITTHFPEKRTEQITRTSDGVIKEDYDLIYYSKDSDITVEFEEDEKWAKYSFSLQIKKK